MCPLWTHPRDAELLGVATGGLLEVDVVEDGQQCGVVWCMQVVYRGGDPEVHALENTTMTRMTVTVDLDLLQRAKEALGASTKAEAIRLALSEVVRRQQLAAALQHCGQVNLDLDQEKLERLRQDS